MSSQFHATLNKKLPNEIILNITSYLSIHDIINLYISKMFLPALISMPFFFNKINNYFLHLFGVHFNSKINLFVKCVLSPVIYEQEFYFAVDTYKLCFMSHVFFENNTINLMNASITYFTFIANSFHYYINTHHHTPSLTSCNSSCICHSLKYTIYKETYFDRCYRLLYQ